MSTKLVAPGFGGGYKLEVSDDSYGHCIHYFSSNPGLLHWRQILYVWAIRKAPHEW